MNIEYSDRYTATGRKPPSVMTVCRGQCEGMGVVPIDSGETDPTFAALWHEAEAKSPADDGWHFVKCPECGGTGKQRGPVALIFARNLPRILHQKARFARFHLFSTSTWRKDVPHWRWFNLRIVLKILLTSW